MSSKMLRSAASLLVSDAAISPSGSLRFCGFYLEFRFIDEFSSERCLWRFRFLEEDLREGMAEIDTKPFESVQAALSLFEQKIDQKSHSSTGIRDTEMEKEVHLLQRDLANYRVQLEIKESANMQAMLKLEVYHKTIEELSSQLKFSEADRDKYIEECREAQVHIDRLESDNKAITGQLLESSNYQAQILCTVDELKSVKAEVTAAMESKVAALRQTELMGTAVGIEKEKNKELLMFISDLNEALLSSNLAAIEEAEKAKSAFFAEMEADLQIAPAAVHQPQEQLEEMEKQLDMMNDLECELLAKILNNDYLRLELKQVKELHSFSAKAASNAIDDLNRLKSEIELIERENSEKSSYILSMEAEVKRSEEEHRSVREEVDDLRRQIDMVTSKLKNMKDEMSKTMERELELQVDIATLKSELHKGRSKVAAAEAAEARAMSAQAGLYLAIQQLAVEAEKAKNETRRLKLEANNAEIKTTMDDASKDKGEVRDIVADSKEFCSGITISIEEYESLIRRAEKADQAAADSPPKDESQLPGSGNRCEVNALHEELEAANTEISDLKFAVEEAVRRAELSEKAKSAIEDQLRKYREKQQQRRAAAEAIRERPLQKHNSIPQYDKPLYQPPLSKAGFQGGSARPERSTSMYHEKPANYTPLERWILRENTRRF